MSLISEPISSNLTLEKTIARLSANSAVLAILQIGSITKNQLTPHSDYDLVIILEKIAQPWFVGVTTIDHRFTDLIFVDVSAVSSLLDLASPVPHTDALAPIIRWLREGDILFARDTAVQQARQKVRNGNWIEPLDDEGAYGAWFRINYNLAQLKRISQSPDPLVTQVSAIRTAVYGFADVWFGYFDIRKLEWAGDKAAVRYLSEHDPEFLYAFEAFVNAPVDLPAKLDAYEKAASIAAAPLGGLWPEEATVMNIPDTDHLWSSLLGVEPI